MKFSVVIMRISEDPVRMSHASQQIMDTLTSTILAAKRVILSVGSGDGSQQAAIAKSGHHNIVSTFFDSEDTVTAKYPSARGNITFL